MLSAKTAAIFWVSYVSCWAMAGPAYPLKLATGQHCVVDQNNSPFFIQGDSAWLLSKYLTAADQNFYLSNRCVQGFNSIIMDMHPRYSGGGTEVIQTADAYGQEPFTNTIPGHYTNLLSMNERYFTNVDSVIQRADALGMTVFLYPMYDGYPGSVEGWWDQMVGNGSNTLFQYGQWVGNRYRNTPNLVYIGAGDFDEPNPPNYLWNAVANGILSVDTNHLFTAQTGGSSARAYYSNAWCNLNCTYARSPSAPYITYDFAIANYQVSPVVASFSREPYYEFTPYSPANTAYDCRRYAWGSVLYGEAGHFYGNAHIATYNFDSGWQTQLWSQGVTVTNVGKLMRSRPWWNCVPDSAHTTITAGFGTYGQVNFTTCMRETVGRTIIAYIPGARMTATVDMTRISGSTANAWWYDPRTGASTPIGTYNTTGTRTFTPADTNDCVLVLDDASQGYGPPGSPARLIIQQIGGSQLRLSSFGTPGQSYTLQFTADLRLSWQALTNVIPDSSGNWTFDLTGTATPGFYRWSFP
jgi:hypothetical protein